MIFDTHAHYDDEAFDPDRGELLDSLAAAGIGAVANIGASLKSCETTLELVRRYPWMYGCLGVHPSETAQLTQEGLDWLRQALKSHARIELGGVIHCFSYSKEMAREYLNMGFYLGIGGVVTFKNAKKLKEVVEYMPLDRLVLETDCPYLAPVPNRGKRNSSLNLPFVVEVISQLKGITAGEVEEAAWENALKLYRIPRTAD